MMMIIMIMIIMSFILMYFIYSGSMAPWFPVDFHRFRREATQEIDHPEAHRR